MATVSGADTSIDLSGIEARIAYLQYFISGQISPASTPASDVNISQKLGTVVKDFEKLLKDHESLDQFLQEYGKTKHLLDSPESIMLDSSSKTSLVVANEEFIQETARSLEIIKNHEKYINPDHLSEVPSLVKKLAPLEVQHSSIKEETIHSNEQLESLLNSYNQIVHLLSEKFTYWDSLLTLWEKNIDQKITKSHAPKEENTQ